MRDERGSSRRGLQLLDAEHLLSPHKQYRPHMRVCLDTEFYLPFSLYSIIRTFFGEVPLQVTW